MATNPYRDEGDYFPSLEDENASNDDMVTGSQPKRSVTPRGHFFMNLGDAHRIITSKFGTNNPFRKSEAETGDSNDNISLKEMPRQTSPGVSDFVLASIPRPETGRSAADGKDQIEGSSAGCRYSDETKTQSRGFEMSADSTLGIIVDHYTTRDSDLVSSSFGGSSGKDYTLSNARPSHDFHTSHHEGATTRLACHDDQVNGTTSRQSQKHEHHDSHRDLVPKPLRLVSAKDHQQTSQKVSDSEAEASVGVASSSTSDKDPFKYDNEKYRELLRQGEKETGPKKNREREISRQLEGLDDDELPCQVSHVSDNEPSKHAHPSAGVFDQSTLDSLHGTTGTDDVRVVIRKASEEKQNQLSSCTFGLTVEREKNRLSRDPTNDGDWLTEVTSEVSFGGEGVLRDPYYQCFRPTGSSIADCSDSDYFPPQVSRIGSRDPILQHPSSHKTKDEAFDVRTVKDTDQTVSFPRPRLNRVNGFAQNTLRLKDPTETEDTPIRLPNPRIVANPFSPEPLSAKYQRADRNDNFFKFPPNKNKSLKYQFRDSASEFAVPIVSNDATRGTYRTSTLRETMDLVHSEAVFNQQVNPFASEKDTPNKGKQLSPLRINKTRRGQAGEDHVLNKIITSPVTSNIYDVEPSSAASKFSFPLIDLPSAQRLQKMKRESGDTDETEDSATRYQRARSGASIPSVTTPSAVRPSAAYMPGHTHTGSRLSSAFMPPDDDHPPSSPLTSDPRRRLFTVGSHTPRIPFSPRSSQAPTMIHTPTLVNRCEARVLPNDKQAQRNDGDRRRTSLVLPRVLNTQAHEDANISYQAHSRRKAWFYMMVSLSILPFFAVLILIGVFNDSLSWFTHGEVSRLTKRQRQFIKIMLLSECIIYTACIAAIVVYFVTKVETP